MHLTPIIHHLEPKNDIEKYLFKTFYLTQVCFTTANNNMIGVAFGITVFNPWRPRDKFVRY